VVTHLRESLAGRKSIFYLYPLTFQEFITFKDEEFARNLKEKTSFHCPE